jgi:hypothetical protein
MAKPSLEFMMRSSAKADPEEPAPAQTAKAASKVLKLPPSGAPESTAAAVEIDKVTLYLPKPAYRFIKQTALDHDKRAHDVLLEGVELVLARYGKTLADFTGKQ